MPEENMQDNQDNVLDISNSQNMAQHSPMSTDDHAAALGFITTLSKGLLPQQEEQKTPSQDAKTAPGAQQSPPDAPDPQAPIQQQEGQVIDEIRTLKASMDNQDLRQQFQVVKNEIEAILEADDTSEKTKTQGA